MAPKGGPLRGGTRVTFIAEGIDGYGAALDAIMDQMDEENIFASNSWYMSSGGLPTSRQHNSRGAALVSIRTYTKCKVGDLGTVSAVNVEFYYRCNTGTVLWPDCFENTTFSCFVPGSPTNQTVEILVSPNAVDDDLTPEQYVPVTGSGVHGGHYTYYVAPTVSLLIPPGGPTRGSTTVTMQGVGFDGLGADLGGFGCSFGNVGGIAISMSPFGDQ
eukprot:2895359-Prymnesium_polylepis.1